MIVVDCSALIDVMTRAEGTDELNDVLAAEELHAPTLIDYEVVAAVGGLVRRSALSMARGEDALTDYDSLVIRRWDAVDALRRRALAWRDNVSAYDAAYVVLAEALDCPLVTRDRRLATAADRLVEVVLR